MAVAGVSAWVQAQQAVIGSLMLAPERCAGEIFQRARPEHFGDAAMRHVFEACRALWDDNLPIDPVTAANACGADEYVHLIAGCMKATPTAENVSAWLGILQSRARIAALQTEAMRIVAEDVSEEAALEAYERMGEMLQGTEDIEDLSLTDLISDYIDRMKDQSPPDYLSWGIEKLDRTLAISPGKFVILAADSSVGKTALALQFAYHIAASGKRVGFFSIETDKESLADRIMAQRQVASIPLPVTKQKKLGPQEFEQAGRAGLRSDTVPLRIIRKADTIPAIRGRTLMRKFEVIFIDYVQLIDAPGQERWDIVTNISMSLHRMAQRLGITVVGLSQITPPQKGGKQRPTKDDLRESRQLKQDADAILILSPSTDEDDPSDTRILEVVKNKDGRCGAIKLKFEAKHMTFSEAVPYSTEQMNAIRSEGKAVKNQNNAKAKAKAKAAAEVPQTKAGEVVPLPDDGEVLPF